MLRFPKFWPAILEDVKHLKHIWVLFAFLSFAAFGVLSLSFGQDINWDLRNYHFYTPYAVLNDRLALDHNAAGLQTTINPTLDILTTYPLIKYGSPVLFSFLLGGFHGLNFVLLVAIFLKLFKNNEFFTGTGRLVFALLSALLSVSGAFAVSEIGTTFGDLTLSVFNLASILLLLNLKGESTPDRQIAIAASSGLLIGLSAGLKLTNLVYLISLFVSFFVVARENKFRLSKLFSLFAFIGFAIAHGWWSIRLWSAYKNPIFPFFNSFFRSLHYPVNGVIDDRFLPYGLMQSLFYPFFFYNGKYTSEHWVVDYRFPIAYICTFIVLLWIIAKRINSLKSINTFERELVFLWCFILVSYVLWQFKFSIQRYAITIELLLPLFILATLLKFMPRASYAKASFFVLALFLAFTTKAPNWGRFSLKINPFYEVKSVLSEGKLNSLNNSAIILGTQPLAWMAPTFDLKDAIWLGSPFNAFDRQIALRKLESKRKVHLVALDTPDDLTETQQTLFQYGLNPLSFVNCEKIGVLMVCPMEGQNANYSADETE